VIIHGTIEELGPLPGGTIARRIGEGQVEIVGPDQEGIIAALPLRWHADQLRAQARAEYEASIPQPQAGINLALMAGTELAFRAAALGGLDEAEAIQAQQLLALAAAVRVARARLDARLAEIDSAEAAGDVALLKAGG
jgi:hypothetical protein